jgi:hypothetical protein
MIWYNILKKIFKFRKNMSLQSSIANTDRNRLTSFNPVRSVNSLQGANTTVTGTVATMNATRSTAGVQIIINGTVSAATIVVEQAIGFSSIDEGNPPTLIFDSNPLYTWSLATGNSSGEIISVNDVQGTMIRLRVTAFTGTGSVDGWLAV